VFNKSIFSLLAAAAALSMFRHRATIQHEGRRSVVSENFRKTGTHYQPNGESEVRRRRLQIDRGELRFENGLRP
jgi:hypothetical protein